MVQLINNEQQKSGSHTMDVSAKNFMEAVIQKSQQVPVVVDFWATWCAPCKTLTPILEGLADKFSGAFQLVKIDIDKEQELAGQFNVRSVPSVFMIKDGRVVDGFMGVQPQNVIEQFLSKHGIQLNQQPKDEIDMMLGTGSPDQAIDALKKENTDASRLRLAQLYLRIQDIENAQSALDGIKKGKSQPEYKSTAAALEMITLAQNCEPELELIERIKRDFRDWDAHYKLAAINLTRGNPEEALISLLEIVKHDRDYNNDAGRLGLIKAFDMLGSNHELVPKYRGLLARTLH